MIRTSRHTVMFLIISVLMLSMLGGCSSTTIAIIPGTNPNPSVNPENSEVSYIEVTSSASTMNTGETMQFVVKGYNSDSEQVIIDKSKIVLWRWTVTGVACADCISGLVHLNPTSNSFTTSFSSGKAATFHICAYYKDVKPYFRTIQVTSKVKTIYDINSKK